MKQISSSYDVIVAGGGSAGVAAAVGAARCGARTLLIERYGFLGGAATASNVLTYCGFYRQDTWADPVIGGVGTDCIRLLEGLGQEVAPRSSRTGNWILVFDPEMLKYALDRLCELPGLDVALHAFVVGATIGQGRIESITIADHGGLHEIHASAFVDATGESDLARRAGLATHGVRTGATGLQAASFPVRVGGVPRDAELPPDLMRAVATACHAEDPSLPIRADGGVSWRLPNSGDFWWMGIDFAVDGSDGGAETNAEIVGRRASQTWIRMLRRHASFQEAYIAATGPQLGVRETPHVLAEVEITADEALQGLRRADGIARAGWPMEVHAEPGRPKYARIGGDGFFDVPYGAICAAGRSNLWLAGRTIGSDAAAFGSIRVMGTAFATGHAAGIAAALDTRRGESLKAVQSALLSQRALI